MLTFKVEKNSKNKLELKVVDDNTHLTYHFYKPQPVGWRTYGSAFKISTKVSNLGKYSHSTTVCSGNIDLDYNDYTDVFISNLTLYPEDANDDYYHDWHVADYKNETKLLQNLFTKINKFLYFMKSFNLIGIITDRNINHVTTRGKKPKKVEAKMKPLKLTSLNDWKGIDTSDAD